MEQIKILYSQRHEFLYHPDFHPERKGQVACVGWRAVVEVSENGETGRAEAILGLSREAVESVAIEFARAHLNPNEGE